MTVSLELEILSVMSDEADVGDDGQEEDDEVVRDDGSGVKLNVKGNVRTYSKKKNILFSW